jgi:hypothetical protein
MTDSDLGESERVCRIRDFVRWLSYIIGLICLQPADKSASHQKSALSMAIISLLPG